MTVYNVASISNTTFAGNTNITSVDLSGIPIVSNRATNMFNGCTNLQHVYRLNKNIITLYHAFDNCTSLIESPIIPDNVTDITGAFRGCTNLVKAPIIPNSVQSMRHAFMECTNMINTPIIPEGVESLSFTFCDCTNITTAPTIPNSVTDMDYAFRFCEKLTTVSIIPNNVTRMDESFCGCTNLTGDITIKSTEITSATNCFLATSLTKNVYMPITYANGVNTATYNSFIAAGYDANGTTNGVYIKDIDTLRIPNWTWTESGNKVTLTAYNGVNNVVVPNVETLRNL